MESEVLPPEIDIRVTHATGGLATISIRGDIDLATVDRVTAVILGELAGGYRHLHLELAGVTFAGGAALAAFETAQQRCRDGGGELTLDHVPLHIARVLDIADFDSHGEHTPDAVTEQ